MRETVGPPRFDAGESSGGSRPGLLGVSVQWRVGGAAHPRGYGPRSHQVAVRSAVQGMAPRSDEGMSVTAIQFLSSS